MKWNAPTLAAAAALGLFTAAQTATASEHGKGPMEDDERMEQMKGDAKSMSEEKRREMERQRDQANGDYDDDDLDDEPMAEEEEDEMEE